MEGDAMGVPSLAVPNQASIADSSGPQPATIIPLRLIESLPETGRGGGEALSGQAPVAASLAAKVPTAFRDGAVERSELLPAVAAGAEPAEGALRRHGECSPNCGACCTYIILQVNPQYNEVPDVKHWIELHDIRLVKRDGALWAYIPTPCSALDGTRCSLYGTEDRPKVCDVWPTSQAEINDLEDHTGQNCTYSFSQEE